MEPDRSREDCRKKGLAQETQVQFSDRRSRRKRMGGTREYQEFVRAVRIGTWSTWREEPS